VVHRFISQPVGLPASIRLPSRNSSKPLADARTSRLGIVNVEATAVLLERVTKQESDQDVSCAAYDAMTATAPGTPRVSALHSTQSSTRMTTSSGSDMDIGSTRKTMDPKLLAELQGHSWAVDDDSFFDHSLASDWVVGNGVGRTTQSKDHRKKRSKYESSTAHKWPCSSAETWDQLFLRVDPASMSEPEIVVMGVLHCVLSKAETRSVPGAVAVTVS
jgi:hypothetical protein